MRSPGQYSCVLFIFAKIQNILKYPVKKKPQSETITLH